MTLLWLPKTLRDAALSGSRLFDPRDTSKLSSWVRLENSSQSAGEWNSFLDVLAASTLPQTDADRKAAVGTSANGLPTAVFDGSDMYLWPLNGSINNMTTKLGFWFWFKPAAVASIQRLLNCTIAAGGAATFEKFSLYTVNQTLQIEIYVTNATGRVATTASNVLTAATWHSIYMQYDSSRGGDPNLALYVNGSAVTMNYANIGAGATLSVLQAPTGNIVVGAFNNSDTPTQPIETNGELGPNMFAFNDNLQPGEIAALQLFEAPT